MIGLLLVASMLQAAPADAAEAPFEPAVELFADAAACRLHLEGLVAAAKDYDAVRGPYAISEGDIRIHMVRAEGSGHRIWEHRCLAEKLSARSWNHSMAPADEPFTLESAAARAEWLKKDGPKQ
jgi:hypothetical protein